MTALVTSRVTVPTPVELGQASGLDWFDYQTEAFEVAEQQSGPLRMCLYYRTGAGKTITSLALVRLAGYEVATVIAPPITHEAWEKWGTKLGVTITAMSHEKYRMKGTKLSRHVPVIADEFHKFGGHEGQGWTKLDAMAKSMPAPVILASATPNYNDAERVYCVQHILDPYGTKGGYLQFLFDNCELKANPFGAEPKVTGFRNHKGAEEYLAALPGVIYVPDTVVYDIEDVVVDQPLPDAFERYGLDRRRGRLMASQMEKRHATERHLLLDDSGTIREHVFQELLRIVAESATPVLVFCAKTTISEALYLLCNRRELPTLRLDGKTSKTDKRYILDLFKGGTYPVLVGTATLATGTDGIDKMCDTLVIVNDTDDDAQRRQLIGRIMPRGADDDASRKKVYRIIVSS